MIYMVVKMLGVVVAVSSTPYTLKECEQSLSVLTPVPELESEFYCTAEQPELGELNDQQLARYNRVMAELDSVK